MAHAAKYTRTAAARLAAHYERMKVPVKKENGETAMEYIKFGNQDIDLNRTHLNYNLAPEREGGQAAFLKQRLSEVKVLNRADVNVMCSWVVTLPKVENMDQKIHATPNHDVVSRLFFERTYDFMAARYGEENVISSYVHRDETNDHMHFSFIPVMADTKTGGEKVCAKKVLSRTDLRSFHEDLERHLDTFGDWHFEVLNGATKEGNKAIAELKRGSAVEDLQQQQLEAAQKIQELRMQEEREIAAADRRKETVEKQISALERKRDGIMTSLEVADLNGKKIIGGGLKGVTFSEYEALKRTAEKVDDMREDLARANSLVEKVDQRVAAAYEDARKQLRELRARDEADLSAAKSQVSWEVQQLRRENQNLKAKVSRLERVVDYLKGMIREKLPEMVRSMENRIKQILNPEREQVK